MLLTLSSLIATDYDESPLSYIRPRPRKSRNVNRPPYRLFVLGAGFSAHAGLPLGNDLLERVRENVRGFFQRFGWDGPLEREIEEWSSLYPGESIDLERVLAYSHRKHYLGLLGSDEYFAHGSRSIVAARRAIQRILIQATPSDTPKLYQDFAQRLCPRDVVLTFNYDTLLEQALDDIGKPYTLTPEWWLKTAPGDFEPKFVDILKLHGSIDWYDRYYIDDAMRRHTKKGHDVPNRDSIFSPDRTVPSEPLSRGQRKDGFGDNILPRVFRVPDHAKYFPIEERVVSQIVPFFLPPAYDKLLGYAPILDLWENLHRTQDYSSIVVIGYSMPPYDSYAYEALGQLLVEYQQGGDKTYLGNRRVPIQLITLVDPGQHDLKCFPFLDPDKTRIWNQGFSTDALNWVNWGDGADHPAVT